MDECRPLAPGEGAAARAVLSGRVPAAAGRLLDLRPSAAAQVPAAAASGAASVGAAAIVAAVVGINCMYSVLGVCACSRVRVCVCV
jgi:hypothetical protein